MLKTELNASSVWARIAELRQNDINLLAPKFKQVVLDSLDDLKGKSVKIGDLEVDLDVVVFETKRTNELQRIYYSQGTTNAKTAERSWHFYGLAIDIISHRYEWFDNEQAKRSWPNETKRFSAGSKWFLAAGNYFEKRGCSLGSKWEHPDSPHIQWPKKKSPNEEAGIYYAEGLDKIWDSLGAA